MYYLPDSKDSYSWAEFDKYTKNVPPKTHAAIRQILIDKANDTKALFRYTNTFRSPTYYMSNICYKELTVIHVVTYKCFLDVEILHKCTCMYFIEYSIVTTSKCYLDLEYESKVTTKCHKDIFNEKIVTMKLVSSKCTMELRSKVVKKKKASKKKKRQQRAELADDYLELTYQSALRMKKNKELEEQKTREKQRKKDKEELQKLIQESFDCDEQVLKIVSEKVARCDNMTGYMKMWTALAGTMYFKLKNCVTFSVNKTNDVVVFYQEYLRVHCLEMFGTLILDLKDKKIFDKFNPKTRPLVAISIQASLDDAFPTPSVVVSADKLVKYNLLPKNLTEFNPYNKPLIIYGLFYGLYPAYNVLYGYFEGKNNNPDTYSIEFDRTNIDMHNVLKPSINAIKHKNLNLEGKTVALHADGTIKEIKIGNPQEKE